MVSRIFFWPKLALFLVPSLAYLATTVGLAMYAGEFTPLEAIAARQAGPDPFLYGRAYRDNYFAYKLVSARVRRPEILVVGSSRSMQFRSELFSNRKGAFYNAGGAVQNVNEIREFLNGLGDSALPKLLILGLDQPWFNTRTAEGFSTRRIRDQLDDENVVPLNRAMNVGKFVLGDLLEGKISPPRVFARKDPLYGGQARGMAAVSRGSGFRNDGSYQYASVLAPRPVEERLAEGHQRLLDDVGHFSHGDSVSEPGIAEVTALLGFCKGKGIEVTGFFPPYAPSIYRKMAKEGRHTYMLKAAATLQAVFRKKGFAFYDFSDAALLGIEDEDMVDGFHGSEFVYLKIHLAFLETMPVPYNSLVDKLFLLERLGASRAHRLVAFDNP